MITLSKTHLTEIQSHGIEAYPEECCGAMLGQANAQREKVTTEIVRIENNWVDNESGSRHRRFAITAEDYRKLEKMAKEKKLSLLGFYHTHPDHPAKPSATDLSYAWPFFSYIILSVRNRKASDIYSYELSPSGDEFIEETLGIC